MPPPKPSARRFIFLPAHHEASPPTGQFGRQHIPWWSLGLATTLGAAVALLVVALLSSPTTPAAPTTTVQRGPLEVTVSEKGETVLSHVVEVRCDGSELAGKFTPVVPEGAHVTKGQPIAQFDVATLEKLCTEQESKVRLAQTALTTARQETENQQSKAENEEAKAKLALELALMDQEKYQAGDYQIELEERQRAVTIATRELTDAQERLGHYRTFVKKGFGTLEHLKVRELETTRAQFNLLREQGKLMILEKYMRKRQLAELAARVDQARRDLQRTRATNGAALAKAKEEATAAEAAWHLAQLQLQRLQQRKEHPLVTAPAAGLLVYPQGQSAPAQTPVTLCRVIDPDQMQVSMKLPACRARKLRPGQKAKVRFAHSERRLEGTVRTVAPASPAQGDTLVATTVQLETPPADMVLKSGVPAEVEVVVEQIPDAMTLPRDAVIARQDQHFALVVSLVGLELRPIAVGPGNAEQMEVRSGLVPGEQVVLDARERVTGDLLP